MVALGLREGAGARKHEATLESLLTNKPSCLGFSWLKLFPKASDSAKPDEEADSEKIAGNETMRTAKNICIFLCLPFI